MNNENKVPVLSFQNIGKAFGENWVLSDVSMDIMPGEIHAICGENGAGKSTLMNILFVLARKLYDHVLADANVEISSDEARVIHLQKLLYVTQDLSETEVQEKKAAAEQAAAGIAEGKDFAAVSGDGVITELEVMRGQMDPDVETAVFALATGEVSPVLDTDEGYVVYKCTDSYDEAASNANKTKLLAEHRDQVFNEYLDSYLKEHQALFNDQAWEKLSISGYQGAASANFYTIYQQYFSEQQ